MPFKFAYFYQYAAKFVIDALFSFRKILNADKKRIYIYTDSRGFYVNKWYCKKNPLFSYIHMLANSYCVDYSLCDYKHTTLLDFLCDYEEKIRKNKYDAIILHLGVVDFSPRTSHQAQEVLNQKRNRLIRILGEGPVANLSIEQHNENYEGQATSSIYTKDCLRDFIINRINKIETTVIWIGVNRVLTDWNGNYSKKRPDNINKVLEYQEIINQHFSGKIIPLDNLSDQEIKTYTVDNIHLSIEGFRYVHKLIEEKLNISTDKGQIQ